MIKLRFEAMPEETARAFQSGAKDANNQPPERHVSDGQANPCRHCLTDIAAGEPLLILAYRPMPEPQPYAEVGPVFLHAEPCDRYDRPAGVPAMLLNREQILIRGYGDDHRIVYGSGRVIPSAAIAETAEKMFERPEIAYIHPRSASHTCFQCRIDRS